MTSLQVFQVSELPSFRASEQFRVGFLESVQQLPAVCHDEHLAIVPLPATLQPTRNSLGRDSVDSVHSESLGAALPADALALVAVQEGALRGGEARLRPPNSAASCREKTK